MKTTKLLLAATVFAMMFASCGKKENPQMKADIAAFETSWNETGAVATAWSADLKQMVDVCQKDVDDGKAMDMSKMKKEDKAAADSGMMACEMHLNNFKAMWSEYEGFNKQWEADSKAWAEWRAKYDRGEVKDEEATSTLNDWKAKHAEAKAKLDTWTAAYNTEKAACEENRAKMMQMKERMAAPAEKKM